MKKTLFIVLTCLLAIPLMASAEATVAEAQDKATASPILDMARTAVKGAIARCPIIESKIQVKVTAFDNTKMKHLNVYGNLKDRLTTVADRLTARGVDVTALRADLAVLDQKIAKFSTDYAAYITKLKASQESVCGKSSAEFKAKLKETKTALQLMHLDTLDIRTYVATVIKAEINKIRISLKAPATTTSSTINTIKPSSTAPVKPLAPSLPVLD